VNRKRAGGGKDVAEGGREKKIVSSSRHLGTMEVDGAVDDGGGQRRRRLEGGAKKGESSNRGNVCRPGLGAC